MANTKTKKDERSIARAPQPITPACFNIAGMAMLPIVEAPVKNLVAFTQLFHHPIGCKNKLNDYFNGSAQIKIK